jgi:hypothetical protein
MPDYKNGQIYRLWSPHADKFYIGSTCNMLAKRLYEHKTDFKCYLNKKRGYVTSYELFKFGIDDVKIELMELFPCNSKAELCRREGILQREHKDTILNFIIAGRTDKEYHSDNRDNRIKKSNEYYYINHDELLNKSKEYYHINHDERLNKSKEYYKQNKDIIIEKQRQRRATKKTLLATQEVLISTT